MRPLGDAVGGFRGVAVLGEDLSGRDEDALPGQLATDLLRLFARVQRLFPGVTGVPSLMPCPARRGQRVGPLQ